MEAYMQRLRLGSKGGHTFRATVVPKRCRSVTHNAGKQRHTYVRCAATTTGGKKKRRSSGQEMEGLAASKSFGPARKEKAAPKMNDEQQVPYAGGKDEEVDKMIVDDGCIPVTQASSSDSSGASTSSPSPAPSPPQSPQSPPPQGAAPSGSPPPPMRGKARKLPRYHASNGVEHLGSALNPRQARPFPGPPPDEGPPLRVLPVGGLGEIGMNCMLVGVKDRYILIDAGLMFPDFQEIGMQKILPDTSFLYEWRDKIEAVIITHGHEDHIGALPWVVPALDPSTPIYSGSFVLRLLQRRMLEFSLWQDGRFRTFNMKQPFQAGPFQVTPIRVTHSIPDCCGLILKSDYGTIVHTGDWKIDENPSDGQGFDRETFELLGREPVTLFMSDSTNVLSPGRSTSEATVEDALVNRVLGHQGKGRVVLTQFASNVHRLTAVKKAADASGRRICFVGASLNAYLDAAHKDGRAPIDPREVLSKQAADDMDPNQVLVVTTGSQAEPRAALSLAAKEASPMLKILPSDLILYSAKVIPGNETRVMKMLNDLTSLGADVAFGASERLHASGHAYQGELTEVLQAVKPQHFLPVHGEYAFLVKHAELAREKAGCQYVEVIRNGQMLGVGERPSGAHVSSGSMAVIGQTNLTMFYNDGNKGTGTAQEMAIDERVRLAYEGCVVAAVVVSRPPGGAGNLRTSVRLTARGMWVDGGKMLEYIERGCMMATRGCAGDAPLQEVERAVTGAIAKACRAYNQRRPEIIVFAHEYDPRAAHLPSLAGNRRLAVQEMQQPFSGQEASTSGRATGARRATAGKKAAAAAASPASQAPQHQTKQSDPSTAPTPSGSLLSTRLEKGAKASRPFQQRAGPPPPSVAPPPRIPPGSPPMEVAPQELLTRRKRSNPRESPQDGDKADYGFD